VTAATTPPASTGNPGAATLHLTPTEALTRGHALVWDPPAAMTGAERWTCQRCGRAVIRYSGVVSGAAAETDCQEAPDA
jgi:hypothetical protein